jgi:hypothetical protein
VNRKSLIRILLGLAVITPGCSASLAYHDRPGRYVAYSAFDEGYRLGYNDGRNAGHRDLGRSYRRNFWEDGRYRRGDYGYRRHYGPRSEYAAGYRDGYERGYDERRSGDRSYRRR